MKVPNAVVVVCILFVASAAGCLGPQRHLEVVAIVSSSRPCRGVRHGGYALDRGRADVDGVNSFEGI